MATPNRDAAKRLGTLFNNLVNMSYIGSLSHTERLSMTTKDLMQQAYRFHNWAHVYGLPWRNADAKRFSLLCKAKALIVTDRLQGY